MHIHSILTCTALALSVALAHAAEPSNAPTPLTRAQVKQSVIDARAAGELSVGEDPNYPYIRPQSPTKAFKRKAKLVAPNATAATAATESDNKKP